MEEFFRLWFFLNSFQYFLKEDYTMMTIWFVALLIGIVVGHILHEEVR